MDLAVRCYETTRSFPREEAFGLTSQIRRAAASVAANIAEGHGRQTTNSFVHFLRVAQGSLKELETHIILSRRVELMTDTNAQPLLGLSNEIGKMLRSLIRNLENKQ